MCILDYRKDYIILVQEMCKMCIEMCVEMSMYEIHISLIPTFSSEVSSHHPSGHFYCRGRHNKHNLNLGLPVPYPLPKYSKEASERD
jgi:hypothetical protein